MALSYYAAPISDHILEMPNGVLVCKDVPIGRVGSLRYIQRDIFPNTNEPFKPLDVYRTEEDVFDPAALASFEGVAVTDGHPTEDVTVDNWGFYAKGHVQNVRRGMGDNADKMVADLLITDKILQDKIRNKVKRQVSSGYDCSYKVGDNGLLRQIGLRGNHVAVVEKGRAGESVTIKDSLDQELEQESILTNKSERRPKRMAGIFNKTMNQAASILNLAVKSATDAKSVDQQDQIVEDAVVALGAMMDQTAPEGEVKVFDAESAFADLAASIQKTNDAVNMLSKHLDAMSLDAMTGKEEQKEAGKELAEGDKKVKEEKAEWAEKAKDEDMKDADATVTVTDAYPGEIGVNEKEAKLDSLLTTLTKDSQTVDNDNGVMDNAAMTDALFVPVATPAAEVAIANETLTFKDAAAKILSAAKPAIAAIKNADERSRVIDSLVGAIEGSLDNSMPNLLHGVQAGAIQSARDTASTTPEIDMEDRQRAYDLRNPHMMKGE